MFRKQGVLILYLLFKISCCQVTDLKICPDGLTPSPPDHQWPQIMPNRFEIFAEVSTDVETFQLTQIFIGPYRDVLYFHSYETDVQTYYDFQTNEMLTINADLTCERTEIQPNEYLPFIGSEILKPSVLLGFDGRNNYNNAFFTRYIGKEMVRDGISTNKFQSCFHIDQENLTINATYYISESPPNQIPTNNAPDFVQIYVRSNNYAYTYNIIRYTSDPSVTFTTPAGAFCPNRINTKEFPKNLPTHLFLYSETYTPKVEDIPSRIESYSRLIDETLKIERIDYSIGKEITPAPPSRLLMDYSANLSFMYTRETQQCSVMNLTSHPMGTTNEILFQFGAMNNSVQFQYTGLTRCGREHVRCHRWIGQRDLTTLVQQYEWYWSASYNDIDLQEFFPVKVNTKTMHRIGTPEIINQELSIFDYNPRPDSMAAVDFTLSSCYRALGPSHNFNYAVLRLTLNNDAKHPVHQHLLSLENRLHIQLATDLRIRRIRLSSIMIETTRDTTDQQDKDVYVTFTLLDNPPVSSNYITEPSSLELIRRLAVHINNGRLHVRDDDGAFDLTARPNSLRTLVLYLSPSENHTNYLNETVFVYHNVTQTVIKQREKIVSKNTGPQITALWTGFALLGIVVALAIGSFIAIRKWTPAVNNQSTT